MTLSVCPIAHVRAPAQKVWSMYTRTGQPGLWLIAGGLAQCRIGSKHLALQIKAIEEGLLPRNVGPRAAIA